MSIIAAAEIQNSAGFVPDIENWLANNPGVGPDDIIAMELSGSSTCILYRAPDPE